MFEKFKLISKKWFKSFLISLFAFIALAWFVDGVIVFGGFALMILWWGLSIPFFLRKELAAIANKSVEVTAKGLEKAEEEFNKLDPETQKLIKDGIEVVADIAEVADALD